MDDLVPFAEILLGVALALVVAARASRLAAFLRIPAPALFLIVAALASDLIPSLDGLGLVNDQRIVTVALVLILFDGGLHIGWERIRPNVGGVVWLGVAGTVVTTAALAVGAHYLFGFEWRTALILGAALAPTDPAVVFSVLGRREISGRSGTMLEGESGANDPVGIAIMVSLLAATGGGLHAVGQGLELFGLQMGIGLVGGLAGGWVLLQVMRKLPLPSSALYPVQSVAFALALYGAVTAVEGSGYLAVFIAGILVGDARAPYKREIENFASALAGLGEIVAFVVLGLSVNLEEVFTGNTVWIGLGMAALLILVVRPLLVGAVLAPIRLTLGERAFVLFSGLKGAVPILLGTYVLVEEAPDAAKVYHVIFVVVLVSVALQGGLVPTAAKLLKVPMRTVAPEPWALGMRFQDEPQGLHRYVVEPGSPADGCTLGGLDVGESFWVSMVSREGQLVQVRGETVLEAGDEVLALAEDDTADRFFCAGG